MENILVLQKNGKSFVNISSYQQSNYLVNGKSLTSCPGNTNWGMIDGEVKSITKEITGGQKLEKFILREPFRENPGKLQLELPPESFEYDKEDYEYIGENSEFYEPVYLPGETIIINENFLIVDKDCEPVILPDYVKIDFPYSFEKYPETWYKYPCSISAENIFNFLINELEPILINNQDKFAYNLYKNIYILDVSIKVDLPKFLYKTEYRQKIYCKKKEAVVIKWRLEPFLYITAKRDKTEGILIPQICGDNYDDLLNKKNKYIDSIVKKFDITSFSVCEHCKGLGIIQNE